MVYGVLLMTGCGHKQPTYQETAFTSAARHKATMRCYTVLGKTYQPTYVEVGDTMEGLASWYGPNFHGKYTSNGERYDMYAKTAAHKTWPMDTLVQVTNLQNGKSTVVRINDRGPFVEGRIIDCSYAAGKELGLDRSGIARVQLTVVGFATEGYTSHQGRTKHPTKRRSSKRRMLMDNFGIQLAAFRDRARAYKAKRRFAKQFARQGLRVTVRRFTTDSGPIHRVWLMGFASQKAAKDFRRCQGLNGPIVRN